MLPIGPDLAHKAGPPIGGIFTTFGRGRGLNFRVKFLGGVRVRVKFFRMGGVRIRGLMGVRVRALAISKVMEIRARAGAP